MDHVEDLIADGAMAFFALDEQGGKLFSQIHSVILHLNDRILHETRGEQMEPAQRIRRIRMIENCASNSSLK